MTVGSPPVGAQRGLGGYRPAPSLHTKGGNVFFEDVAKSGVFGHPFIDRVGVRRVVGRRGRVGIGDANAQFYGDGRERVGEATRPT